MKTQIVDDSEEEVVLDSDTDDEGIHVPKVVNARRSLSSDETVNSETKRHARGDASYLDKAQLTSPCDQDKESVAGSVSSAGCLWRVGDSFSAQRSRASGSAKSCMIDRESHGGLNSIPADAYCKKQYCIKDHEMSRVENPIFVDANIEEIAQDDDNWECSAKKSDVVDKIVREVTVRKISTADAFDEKKVSSSNCESIDGKEDTHLVTHGHELARLSCVESQDPGELSQALDFVDHYLSLNRENLTQEVITRKVNRIKLPPVLSAKGTKKLVKRANLGTIFEGLGTFEWVDNPNDELGVSQRKRNEQTLNSKGQGPRSFTLTRDSVNPNFQKEDSLGIQCKEKLREKIVCLNDSTSHSTVHNCDVIGDTVEISETKIEPNFAKEWNGRFNSESSDQQLETSDTGREVPDTFDVGFDTQMAAEAMESLLYASFADCDADFVHHGPQNTHIGSPTAASKEKGLKCHSSPNGRCSNPGIMLGSSKQTKWPANKLGSNVAGSIEKQTRTQTESDSVKSAGKKLTGPTGRIFANAKKRLRGGSSEVIYPRKEEGGTMIHNVDGNLSLSMSVGCNSFGKGLSRGKSSNSSPIAHPMRHWSSENSSERIEAQINSYAEKTIDAMEVAILTKEKKSSSNINVDVFQGSSVGQKKTKLSSDISAEANSRKVNENDQTDISVLNLDPWSYPKRKRTRTQSNPSSISAAVGERNGDGLSVRWHKKSKRECKSTCFRSDVERKAPPLLVYTRKFRSSSGKKRVGSSLRLHTESSFPNVLTRDSAVMNDERIATYPDEAKASWKYGKPDNVASRAPDDIAEQNINVDLSSHGKAKPSPMDEDGENCKRQYKKNLSRSPLMKELIRLGCNEPLPDFVSQGLRERRNMARVRVLFSKNLDDNVLKQQKKILERLGISIASCCSDATHFIADRFVRTKNMLEAIALGKPVVTHLWLESCRQANCFIDEKIYILRDAKKEKELGFSMPISLARAGKHPLLKDQRVFITPNVQPNKEFIESLVKAVHGQAVERIQIAGAKNETFPADLLLLSCEQDYAICVPFLEIGARVYGTELLLNGIIIQRLEYQRHQLFTNDVKNCSATRREKNEEQPRPVALRR